MTKRSFAFRSTARVVIAGQFLLLSSDLLAARAEDSKKPPKPAPPQAIKANRTLPKVTPPPLRPRFSAQPSDGELFRARVFAEPLVPVGGATQPAENAALAGALLASRDGGQDRMRPIEAFLAEHPRSPWRASLLANLGVVYRRTGYYSRALQAWEEAWSLAKADQTDAGRAVADMAVGELLALKARLGRLQELEGLLEEIAGRDLRGGATERAAGARDAIWMMKNRTGEAFRCGPLALERILAFGKPDAAIPPVLANAQSTLQGTSLTQIEGLARQAGLSLRKAKREGAGSAVPVPAVVHWKAGHFAALLKQEAGRYLVQDPTFGDETWITEKALLDEGSGYYLVPGDTPAAAWPAVTDAEGATVWGRGAPLGSNAGATGQTNTTARPCCNGGTCLPPPMAEYNFHVMLASLNITDTPISYSPPRGPAVSFRVAYNQREALQPVMFSFSNLGQKWSHDWLSYVQDDPGNLSQPARVYTGGGGFQDYTGFDGGTQSYAVQIESQTVLVRTVESPIRYERRHNDGSVEVFAQSDGGSEERRVFLTESRDPQGHALALTYDAQLRLVAITDANGQVTTLSYELAGDSLKITKVTDPFGRSATFEYTGERLTKITDLIGIASEFAYGANDFIYSLKTPYGTTNFAYGENTTDGVFRWVEAVDPLGGRERVQYDQYRLDISNEDPPATIPAGISPAGDLANGSSFYWDKRAMALNPGDPAKARQWHWARRLSTPSHTADVPEAVKDPLENRVWYHYPDQTFTGTPVHAIQGTSDLPDRVARVLDGGTTQTYLTEYNKVGKVCKTTDPVGRETRYTYGTDNVADAVCTTGSSVDLLKTEQKNGANWDVLQTTTYNSQHQPETVTDAAGQTTRYTYLDGRIETVETPERNGPGGTPLTPAERTTTYSYFAIPPSGPLPFNAGKLQSVTGPSIGGLPGPSTSFTYEAFKSGDVFQKSVQTATDQEGYTVTTEFDAMDRPTKTIYPDGTFEETVYNRLDAERTRDRLGRWSETFYDAVRRPVATRDPLGRMVTQQWCTCGSLDSLIDGNGNKTSWERDLQARVTRETRANGSFKDFAYENTTSRLKQVTDAKDQKLNYAYDLDDKLVTITYQDAVIATPNVTFSYRTGGTPGQPLTGTAEPYGRLTTMTDGTGTTTYSYHPAGVLGANQLQSVDGPLANDVIAYGYDELGRATTRTINGAANSQAMKYDSLGRVASIANVLGTFAYNYVGATGRVATVGYPNGQTTEYDYETNLGDRRLKLIHHKVGGGATLSKFDYTTDAGANIKTWRQQLESNPAKQYDFAYDAADQIASAVHKTTDPTPVVLKRFGYSYDKAGNRTGEQLDDLPTTASYDNMNRLYRNVTGGTVAFKGTVNEPAAVTVQGKPATVSPIPGGSTQSFEGKTDVHGSLVPQVPPTTVVIQATDPSGNLRTNTYSVDGPAGTGEALTYDANGNLCATGPEDTPFDCGQSSATRLYEWDAENRLTAVKQGASTLASFTYDSKGRRATKTAAGITHSYVYDGEHVAEERLSSGATGTIRYFHGPGVDDWLGRQNADSSTTYFTGDHLGSMANETNGAGAVTLARSYDPWGNLDATSAAISGPAFTGREWDAEVGLYYYRARYYDPRIARFTSEDPSESMAHDPGDNLTLLDPINHSAPPQWGQADSAAFSRFGRAERVGPASQDNEVNRYVYTLNDPISFVDQNGRSRSKPPARPLPGPPAIPCRPFRWIYGNVPDNPFRPCYNLIISLLRDCTYTITLEPTGRCGPPSCPPDEPCLACKQP